MKFDKIIMNPPYEKTLHLDVLEAALGRLAPGGRCVNLFPCVLLTSARNLWSRLAVTKCLNVKPYRKLTTLDRLDNSSHVFDAWIQQHLGIQVYGTEERDVDPLRYAENQSGLPIGLVRKIMAKCQAANIRDNPGSGSFALPLSGIHGHVDKPDFLEIVSLTYEDQLRSRGVYRVMFTSEEDRRAFYDFCRSPFGYLLTAMWKVDTHVYPGFIPYFWDRTLDGFCRFFDLAGAERAEIEKTLPRYSKKV